MNPNNQIIQPGGQPNNTGQGGMPQPQQPPQNPGQPQPQPYGSPPNYQNNNQPDDKRKKILLFGGIGLGALIVLTLTAVIFYSIGVGNAPEPEPPITQTIEDDGPLPASSLDVQIINNSIGSALSELRNEADFPLDDLSDDELGL